ncbi:hypothetical protein BP6252_13198 [Coleophoma cylindrospora]|uniref:FAD dependent oxidoreductase domain-containing protein n=1 Tax=Coleophoma cylindrospora TaxID=1849047 RepID=A0A3D8QA49_9HELO|nr:hypothetical protein BP6252_13198 [Coleophoma cylindrospora]
MDSESSLPFHVVVLGAGVIGLQTALTLLEKGIKVTIVSKFWAKDRHPSYTSIWSGAQWRSTDDLDDLRQQDWDYQTFIHWSELVKKHTPEELGVELRPAVFYWDHLTPEAMSPEKSKWWSSLVPTFTVLPRESMPSGSNFAVGVSYSTYSVSPPLYLSYLLRSCEALGADCVNLDVKSIPELMRQPGFTDIHGVVNCTGLGARDLVGDKACFPTKGQTLIVKGSAHRLSTRSGDGWEALVIPRPGANETLLGGCKIPRDWSTLPDAAITEMIVERCRPLAPELLDDQGCFEIQAIHVGLRPSREGGTRVDLELLDQLTKDGRPKFVCHNYGHHSAGYEGSVGAANAASKLVMDYLKEDL